VSMREKVEGMDIVEEVLRVISEENVNMADLRFTDSHGKEHHVTVPAEIITSDFFKTGKMFDGSSIGGWKSIDQSDMMLLPDPETTVMDPFCAEKTINIRCDVIDPETMQGYDRDPRTIAKRAEKYLQSTGIADFALFGPEPEFFVFDDVRWNTSMQDCHYFIDSQEAGWNSKTAYSSGNLGHRPGLKGGYFPVPPVDSAHDMRTDMANIMTEMGLVVEAQHHEVAPGQHEIATRFNTLTQKADEIQILKYVVHNTAARYGKTATFMPKPLIGDNGSGMHVHQSLVKNGINLFAGDAYAGLSETALFYMGGIMKHAKALNAITNPTTNSYKRLVPGYEAPVLLAYSARNRSASIRIPYTSSAKERRIEVRFPDPAANPYLALAAMMMAGLDGITNRIHPGEARDQDLYDLPPHELCKIPTVASSLEEALHALDQDHEFLLKGGVFTADTLDAYIKLKMDQVERLNITPHPVEFAMYYSV
jgi:glutamine synthetase